MGTSLAVIKITPELVISKEDRAVPIEFCILLWVQRL